MDNKAIESAEPDLAEALATDRFIKVYVGKHEPFLVQQMLLESLSDYFVRALNRNKFSEGIHGELRIEGDNWNTWKALLHWLFKRMLSEEARDDPSRLIDLWIVGDKYGVVTLQNDAMCALLEYVDTSRDGYSLSVVTIKDGLDRTSPGSVMRKLLAEEALGQIGAGGPLTHEELTTWNTVGLASDMLKATDIRDEFGSKFYHNRFDDEDMLWEDFMLDSCGLGRNRFAFQRQKQKRTKSSPKRLRDD
ncbi:hypothetical protein KC354_g6258 [Hortaea werneckii]|nr:hypothetical protein KC354_g6258 [Hortaea werneckii]